MIGSLSSSAGWLALSRREREELLRLLEETQARREEEARGRLRTAAAQGLDPTPDLVADFALLHMRDDEGRPLRPAPHHVLWLRLMCDPAIRRLLITAPPESAKTTWTLAYMAVSIALQPERPRILASSSGPIATRRSLALRAIVESEPFRETFPEVRRAAGLEYMSNAWAVAPEGRPYHGRIHPTVSSYGTDGPVTGGRAAEIMADDLLDERNTRTGYMRGLVWEWMQNSLFSRSMARIGRIIVIGTVWRHDDPYTRLRGLGGWVSCNIPILSAGPEVRAFINYPPRFRGAMLGEPVAAAERPEEVVE